MNPITKNPGFLEQLKQLSIRVVAPASSCGSVLLEALKRFVEQTGIQVSSDLVEEGSPFHANTDEKRLNSLQEALLDPDANVLWTLKGGYGSARLIDKLATLPQPPVEKTFIGFSDITALHLFLSQQWHWQTIHAHGIAGLLHSEPNPENFSQLMDWITKKTNTLSLTDLKPLNTAANTATSLSGKLTGGNASIVQTSIGTCWQLQAHHKIVFLEDINEKDYRVDRLLHHLKQANLFEGVTALVFGEFSHPTTDPMVALNRFASEVSFPVFKSEQFGHTHTNVPLIYQADSEIIPSANGFTLTMHRDVAIKS